MCSPESHHAFTPFSEATLLHQIVCSNTTLAFKTLIHRIAFGTPERSAVCIQYKRNNITKSFPQRKTVRILHSAYIFLVHVFMLARRLLSLHPSPGFSHVLS